MASPRTRTLQPVCATVPVPSISNATRLPLAAASSLVPSSVRNTTMCRSRAKLTGKITGPWSSTTATLPRPSWASNAKHSDFDSSCQRAPGAVRCLGDCPEPQEHLRVGTVAELYPDGLTEPAKFKWLGVQRGRDPGRAGGEQDSLQGLPGVDPVHRLVMGGGKQADDPGGPGPQRGAEGWQAPAVAVGEVPAGEVRAGVLGPRRVSGRRHAVGPCAARRGSPPGEFGGPLAVQPLDAFGVLDGGG